MYKQLLILGISISLGALAPSAFATKNTTGFPAERGYLKSGCSDELYESGLHYFKCHI